jgi:ribosomal protein S18 acetylase RimI-like enzyme
MREIGKTARLETGANPVTRAEVFNPNDDLDAIAKDIEISELPLFLENWPKEMKEGKITLVVAYVDGRPVGRAVVRWPYANGDSTPPILDGKPTLQSVRVREADRGHGIGPEMVEKCLQEVMSNPNQEEKILTLGVRVDNIVAQKMYEKLGFEYEMAGDKKYSYIETLYELDDDGKPTTVKKECYRMTKGLMAE